MKKTVIIVGGSGKIGSFITNYLSKKNEFEILIIDKFKPKFNNFDKFIKFDLLNFRKYKKLKSEILKKHKSIDILINCAAMVGTNQDKGWSKDFEFQSVLSWQKCLDTNLTSIFLIIQTLLSLLKKSKNPKIINISSIYGFTAPRFEIYKNTKIKNQLAYAVSKAGVIQLTKWFSSYLDKKFSINTISFGGLSGKYMKKNFKQNYSKYTLKKRMLKLEDVIPAINYLISSEYITGQNIIVDGGWSVY